MPALTARLGLLPLAAFALLAIASCGGGSEPTYTLSGDVNGLHTAGLVLAAGSATVAVSANATTFTLPARFAQGASYAVTVQSQPANLNCRVLNGSGKVAAHNVTSVQVICVGLWTWVGGVPPTGQPFGVYGTQGIPSAGNWPGGRYSSAIAQDKSGHVWMFGGGGYDSIQFSEFLNDLWEFTPATGLWTWMSGPQSATSAGWDAVYGSVGIAAPGNHPGARTNAGLWTDPEGRVWLFGGSGFDANQQQGWLNDLWRFDPASGLWTWMGGASTINSNGAVVIGVQGIPAAGNAPAARGSAASWTDDSGNFWLFSGFGEQSPYPQFNDLWKYDVLAGQWAWMSGTPNAPTSSLGVYGTRGVAASTNMPPARGSASTWIDSQNHLWLFGGGYEISQGADAGCCTYVLNDLWVYDVQSGNWTWMSGSDAPSASSVYGILGLESALSMPGMHAGSTSWTDSQGNLWLFGGDSATEPYQSDLWRYRPGTGQWTWMAGTNTPDFYGTYGTKGVAAPNNLPPPSVASMGWSDSTGRLWLFGGSTFAIVSGSRNEAQANYLWTYQP